MQQTAWADRARKPVACIVFTYMLIIILIYLVYRIIETNEPDSSKVPYRTDWKSE